MNKDKFDRNKPRRNIGEIGGGNNITPCEYAMAMELFQYFEEEGMRKKEQLLSELIGKYGIKDGYEKYLEIVAEHDCTSDLVSYGRGKK